MRTNVGRKIYSTKTSCEVTIIKIKWKYLAQTQNVSMWWEISKFHIHEQCRNDVCCAHLTFFRQVREQTAGLPVGEGDVSGKPKECLHKNTQVYRQAQANRDIDRKAPALLGDFACIPYIPAHHIQETQSGGFSLLTQCTKGIQQPAEHVVHSVWPGRRISCACSQKFVLASPTDLPRSWTIPRISVLVRGQGLFPDTDFVELSALMLVGSGLLRQNIPVHPPERFGMVHFIVCNINIGSGEAE